MSTSVSRLSRTLFFLGLSALFFGLIAPIAPAVAAEDFSPAPQAWIDDNSPTVGQELLADLYGPALVPAPDAYAYQWYTVDDRGTAVEIAGATDAKYTVKASDAGWALQVRITVSKPGYNDASDMSYPTYPVKFDFTSGPKVSIDDTTPTADQTISAVVDTPSVPAGTYTYRWYTISNGNPPTLIVGETQKEYKVDPVFVGRALQVQVTATKTDYNDAPDMSAATAPVAKADFSNGLAVSITGTPTVGELLTANLSGVTPEPDRYTYEWKANGIDIHNSSDQPTYTPTKDEANEKITVTVTAVRYGYNSQEVTSAPTANVALPDFTKPPTVTITGTPKVGALLWAVPTGESPAADAYIFVWKANGTEIGFYGQGFSPTVAEIGMTITVTVEATKLDYNPSAVVESEPTAAVTVTAPTATLSTTTPKVGDVVTVTPSGASPTPDSYAYQWYRISTLGVKSAIPGAIGSSYTVPYADLTKKLQVSVTATYTGYTSISGSSVQTAPVNYIALNKTTVTRGQTLGVNAKRLRAGQAYKIYIDGVSVYKGAASSDGSAIRTVGVPTSIGTGTKRVWVSGYTTSGVRDFQVITTVIVK